MYGFRTREVLNLLRIENLDVVEKDSKRRESSISTTAIETIYSIIKNVVRNEARRNRQKSSTASDTRREISDIRQRTRQELPIRNLEISIRTETRLAFINKYRSNYIDIKDAIAFASLYMKDYYDARYQFKFFKINDLVNLRLHRDYRVLIIKSKKLGL